MCGLVSIISKNKYGFVQKDIDLFEQMLYADALRGQDSTGVFGVNKYGNLKMLKSAKPSADFITTKAFKDFKLDALSNARVLVGHNRAATRGATTDQNAHPFIEDHICLVHNGTLYGHKHLADTEVDSHAICHAFAKSGHMDTVNDINGAFALIWYDAKEKKIHMMRNHQRPLWIVQTDSADIIASEPGMIMWLANRVYNKVVEAKYLSTEDVYSWDINTLETSYTTEKLPKKIQPVVEPSKTQQVHTKKAGNKEYKNYSHGTNSKYSKGEVVEFFYERSIIQGNSIKLEGTTIDGNAMPVVAYLDNKKYSAAEIEEILDTGEVFEGKFYGDSKTRSGKDKIFLCDIEPVELYVSINNKTVTERQIMNAGYCCHECGTFIEPDADEGKFWVKQYNDGSIKKMMCPTCVALHPQLSILIKDTDTCTKESQSLDTNLDPDQYPDYALC